MKNGKNEAPGTLLGDLEKAEERLARAAENITEAALSSATDKEVYYKSTFETVEDNLRREKEIRQKVEDESFLLAQRILDRKNKK